MQGKIELIITAIEGDYISEIAAIENRGLFLTSPTRLTLPQSPGNYEPDPLAFDTVIHQTPQRKLGKYGDSFYGFKARVEPYRGELIYRMIQDLIAIGDISLRDYCYLGGKGSLVTVGDQSYKSRIGKGQIKRSGNVYTGSGKVVFTQPLEFNFWEN